jgi:hypothetical protein
MRGTLAVSGALLLGIALMPCAAARLSAAEAIHRPDGFGGRLGYLSEATRSSGKYGWVLKSPVFQALSPVAKRAVLRSAGLLAPPPESHPARALLPASSAGVGQPLGNLRVNNPALDLGYHTHSNSSIATDGTYVAIGFDDDAGPTGEVSISSDGGDTFTQTSIPAPALAIDEGDGAVAFTPNGTLFYSCLVVQENLGVAVASSTNHGNTFSQPVIVSGTIGGANAIQDAPWICADQSANSAFKGNVYASWATLGNSGYTISFTRSTDSGATFQTPVSLPATPKPPSDSLLNFLEGPTMAVGPNGEVYVFYYASYVGTLGSQIFVVQSTDGGTTFSTPSVVASYFTQQSIFTLPFQGEPVYTGGQFGVASNSYPHAAVDPSGNIGVVFEASSLTATGGPDPSNVYFVKSTDGGATFSAPIELNDDGGITTQWRPSIAVTSSGVFGVKWLDRRNDPTRDSLNDVYMAISTDGGNTFSKNFRVTNTSWLFGESDPPQVEGVDYHGSYDTMSALGESFLCSWSDERSGKSDIYFSSVPSSFDPSGADFAITPADLYVSVVAGGASTTIPINIASESQTTIPVTMSASAPVPGISLSFTNASLVLGPAGPNATAVTVSASASAAPGLYIATLTGTDGNLVRNTNLNLTVFGPGQQAGAPINITNTRGNTLSSDQSMTCDSAGNLHLCFLDDTASPGTLQMYYSKSTDGGQTFTTPVLVGGTSSATGEDSSRKTPRKTEHAEESSLKFHPSLASASSPSSSSPAAFAPSTLYSVNDPLIEPSIAVDSRGNIYISVPSFSIVKDKFFGEVLIFKSTDGGSTFSGSTVAATGPCSDQLIYADAIAVNKNGDLIMAYAPFCKEHGLSEASIYVTMSTDGAATFSPPVRVSGRDLINYIADDVPVRITFDSNGGVYVLYNSSTGAFQGLGGKSAMSIRMAVASDGVNFAEPVTVYDAIFAQSGVDESIFFDSSAAAPDILIDSHNNIYVSMIGETPFGEDLYVMSSTDGGASFSTPVNLTKSLDVTFSSPFADSSGNIGYLYTRSTLGIFESRSSDGGKTFFETENISGHLPSIIDHPEVTSDTSGNLYAYWGTTVGGSSDIYLSKFR